MELDVAFAIGALVFAVLGLVCYVIAFITLIWR